MIESKKIKHKFYILGVSVLVILVALVLSNLIVFSIDSVAKDEISKLETEEESAEVENEHTIIGKDPGNYTEITEYTIQSTAEKDGYILYCIEHGTEFERSDRNLPISTALKYGSLDNSDSHVDWPRFCNRRGSHRNFTDNERETYPVLRCVNNHYNLVQNGEKYIPAAGYALTYPGVNSYNLDIQRTVWACGLNKGQKEVTQEELANNKVYAESKEYEQFHNETTNEGENYSTPDIKVEDKTEDNITVKADYKAQTLVVGPFSIDYIYGAYKDIAFGGISDMYMVGYNSEGKKIKDRIEILEYIDNNKNGHKLQFFEPNEQDGSYVDKSEQVYPKGITAGEDSFEVKIANPNKGLSDTADESNFVSSVILHIEFKWMGVVETTVCDAAGYYYTVNWDCTHKTHCHHICSSTRNCRHICSTSCTDCYAYSWLEPSEAQDHISVLKGTRKLFKTDIELGANIYDSGKGKLDIDIDLDVEFELKKNIELTIERAKLIKLTMDLGGTVWEDVPGGKESIADGKQGDSDKVIPNVKVTLYTSDGKVAKLLSNPNETGISDKELKNRINPTYTDENGNYLFKGLDPLKKYYVVFEYNGQKYLPTDYTADFSDTNSVNWQISSKGTETQNDRNTYNSNFAEVGSSPLNYRVGTVTDVNNGSKKIILPIKYLTKDDSGKYYYNETFSQYELMGFVLDGNGDYQNEGIALIDGFYTINENKDIVDTDEAREGIISQKIKEYIKINKKYPNTDGMKSIYGDIVNEYASSESEKAELWRKLQFIEDCKINAYTQSQNATKHDLYPVHDQFIVNDIIEIYDVDRYEESTNTVVKGPSFKGHWSIEYETLPGARLTRDVSMAIKLSQKVKYTYEYTYKDSKTIIDDVEYKSICDGQYYVNLGLWRRQEADVALSKDILYAATRINGKTEVYEYDERFDPTPEQSALLDEAEQKYENNGRKQEDFEAWQKLYNEIIQANKTDYWEIQLRMRDYQNSYATPYIRELYPADYSYRETNEHAGDELELYVTYRITVSNQSPSILTEVKEIVDYYDTDYTYIDDLSWIMYGNNDEITIKKSDYQNTINNYSGKREFEGDLNNNAKEVKTNYGTDKNSNGTYTGQSEYGLVTQANLEQKYNSLYIRGLEGKKLQSGEEAYVYLTFRVNKDDKGRVILDQDDSMKQNYVEINGYSTYYKDNTKLPNGVTVGSTDIAGLIDTNSNPGNLCLEDLQGDKYEKNFENDTDRAKSLKVTVDHEFIRAINGNVWEDQRTQIVSDSIIGNGVMDDKEIKIQGVTVQLVEKLSDGGEYVWKETKTDKNGHYEFKQDNDDEPYIIPGDYIIRFIYGDTDDTVLTNSNSGKNVVSYNGQDFKSTVYQKDIKENKEISGFNDIYYDIRKSDAFGKNVSDAKDLWNRREEVNKYSSSKVTNHIAEVLASPYATSIDTDLITELKDKTNMTAETAIIVLEGEYNRRSTEGDKNTSNGEDNYLNGNDLNGNYTLNNVDFGLTERPKAQLELSKKVTNVKVTLANGSTLFDATKGATDLTWTEGSAYDLYSKIKNKKYEEYYNKDNRYAYRTEVNKLVLGKYDSAGNNGLIAITMDEELMHGATITISYDLTVKNAGETDYTEKEFYYKGTGAKNIVTTTANQVIDYVANNLQFRADDNKDNGWSTVENAVSSVELNNNISDNVAKYNTIIQTEKFGTELKPSDTIEAGLVLTQLITPENTSDDKTYNNIAEITSISNTVGRRMAYSIQGNQNPEELPQEVDSVKSEEVSILPPFGIGSIVTYVAISIGALAILIVGIVFIKKKVIKK